MKQMAHGHHIRSSQIDIRHPGPKILWFYFYTYCWIIFLLIIINSRASIERILIREKFACLRNFDVYHVYFLPANLFARMCITLSVSESEPTQ